MLFESDYKGEWYIPGKKKKSTNGKLTYSDSEGLILELDGLIVEIQSSFDTYYSPPIIWGITPTGEKITLLYWMFRANKGISVMVNMMVKCRNVGAASLPHKRSTERAAGMPHLQFHHVVDHYRIKGFPLLDFQREWL